MTTIFTRVRVMSVPMLLVTFFELVLMLWNFWIHLTLYSWLDTTYKMKKYWLHLLEIVGVTYTCLSFSISFAFLSSEKENRVEVIVCDRDLVLMNVINVVFLKVTNLFFRFHINKNVKAKCKMLVDYVETWQVVMDLWRIVINYT